MGEIIIPCIHIQSYTTAGITSPATNHAATLRKHSQHLTVSSPIPQGKSCSPPDAQYMVFLNFSLWFRAFGSAKCGWLHTHWDTTWEILLVHIKGISWCLFHNHHPSIQRKENDKEVQLHNVKCVPRHRAK